MGAPLIVADTNVVAYLVIGDAQTTKAEDVRRRDGDGQVPSLFPHEWLSVVTRYVRSGLLSRDDALRVYKRGMSAVSVDDAVPDPLRILNLHLASDCTSYDCEFVEAAESRRVQLVTEDQQVLTAFPGLAVSLEDL